MRFPVMLTLAMAFGCSGESDRLADVIADNAKLRAQLQYLDSQVASLNAKSVALRATGSSTKDELFIKLIAVEAETQAIDKQMVAVIGTIKELSKNLGDAGKYKDPGSVFRLISASASLTNAQMDDIIAARAKLRASIDAIRKNK